MAKSPLSDEQVGEPIETESRTDPGSAGFAASLPRFPDRSILEQLRRDDETLSVVVLRDLTGESTSPAGPPESGLERQRYRILPRLLAAAWGRSWRPAITTLAASSQ